MPRKKEPAQMIDRNKIHPVDLARLVREKVLNAAKPEEKINAFAQGLDIQLETLITELKKQIINVKRQRYDNTKKEIEYKTKQLESLQKEIQEAEKNL